MRSNTQARVGGIGRMLVFLWTLGCLAVTGMAAEEAVRAPFARIPKSTPTLEPSLDMQHWLKGAGFAGMTELYLGSHLTWPDAGWYLTYDDKNLYVACLVRTPNAHTRFSANCRNNDDIGMLTDDHLEFQISFESRDLAGAQPFYKVMVNPIGTVYASIINWQPGQDKQGWADLVKVAVHQEVYMQSSWWCTKMAIPLEELGVKNLDGKKALVHLVYASEWQYYTSWGGAGWMMWKDRMGEVEFDPQAPGYNINATFPRLITDPAKGSFILGGSFTPKIDTDKEEKLVFHVANRAEGKSLFEKTLSSEPVKGGKRGSFNFPARMPVAESGNVFSVECRRQAADGAESLLYRCDVPFRKPDDKITGGLQNWIRNHAASGKAAVGMNFAYFPSFDKLHVTLDTRVFLETLAPEQQARAKKIISADSFRASVLENGKEVVGTVSGSIAKSVGEGLVSFTHPMAEGEHKLNVDILSSNEVVDTLERSFVRRKFPWENNRIGLEKVVIPPYTPIARQGESLNVWGREYRVAPSGLFSSIRAEERELLNGEITLVSTQNGKEYRLVPDGKPAVGLVAGQKLPDDYIQYCYKASCPKPPLEPTDGYQAKVTAGSTLGDIKVGIDAVMEYEGLYRVNLSLAPKGKGPVSVDSLDLLVPFAAMASPLMRFEREYHLHGLGAIPEGEGVLFESTKLPRSPGVKGNMPPFVFVGNYSRGLWWMADSDQGWMVDDAKPFAQLERKDGNLLLRMRFVNTPSTLDRERRITFAFQAVPMKPRPPQHRKIVWAYPAGQHSHDSSGFRYYGSGADGFTLYTEDDYKGLKHYFHEMDLRKGSGPMEGHAGNWWGMQWLAAARNGHPLVEYGSTWMASAGMEEFPTFMGEWCYSNDYGKYGLGGGFCRGRMNYGRTYTWTNDLQLTPIVTTANRSFQDCFVWHMTRIAEKCGINGTFYDNYASTLRYAWCKVSSEAAGDAYRRDDGTLQGVHAPFRRHELTKRLATALWLLGRPPFQICAWEPNISFLETSWFIEGPWYHESSEKDLIDKDMTPAMFQASTCKPGQIGYLRTEFAPVIKDGKQAGYNVRAQRLALAYVLLNDLGGIFTLPPGCEKILKKLDERLRFFDGAVLRPYWEATEWVAKPEGVLTSAYVHPEKEKALVVVLNPTGKPVDLSLKLDGKSLLGRDIRKAANFETGAEFTLVDGQLAGGVIGVHGMLLLEVE